MDKLKIYLQNNGTAISRLGSTILGGDPEDTISLRLGECESTCKVCWILCRFLSLFEKEHCQKARERKSMQEDTEMWRWEK